MALRHGVDATSYENYLIGPGAVYMNWESNASKGTLLGETKGGNVFEVIPTFHEVEPDGAMGHILDHTRISRIDVRLTVNLLSVTSANILLAIAGSTSTDRNIIHVPAEFLGPAGSKTLTTLTPLGTTSILSDTLKVYQDTGSAPTLLTPAVNYTWSASNGNIYVNSSGLADDSSITCQYDYDSGSADTMTVITMLDAIAHGGEADNIAIVGEISDTTKTNDCTLILYNAYCMNGLTLTLPGGSEEETVMTLIFEGHWDTGDLTLSEAPFEIRYSNE